MKQYRLLIFKELDKLEDNVTQKLKAGWKLYGNPIIGKNNYNNAVYGQAMTLDIINTYEPCSESSPK